MTNPLYVTIHNWIMVNADTGYTIYSIYYYGKKKAIQMSMSYLLVQIDYKSKRTISKIHNLPTRLIITRELVMVW